MSKQIESAEARGPQLPVTKEKVWPVHPGVPAFNTETGYHFRVCVCVWGGGSRLTCSRRLSHWLRNAVDKCEAGFTRSL